MANTKSDLLMVTSFSRLLRNTLLAFLLGGTLSLIAYGVYSWQREDRDVRESLLILSGFLATASQSFFDETGNSLEPLGELIERITVDHNIEAVRPHLNSFQNRHPQVRAIAVFAPDGKMLINSAAKPGEVLPDFRIDPPYIRQFLKDAKSADRYTLGPPEIGKVLKRWRFPMRHVVRDQSGKAKFVVQVAIPLEKEGTFLHQLPVPPNSYIGLLRVDGFQQARFPVDDGNTIYGIISPGPVARTILSTPEIKAGTFSGLSTWVTGEQRRVGAFARLPSAELFAYISVPASYVIHRWWQHNAPILISFVVFFSLFFLIAYRVTKHESLHSRELFEQASRDVLTGLPNRACLQSILKSNIAGASAGNKKFALLFLDLDRFKGINDTFGHAIGDGLLVKVAQTIQPLLRVGDVLGRFGGDEFLLILAGSDETGVMLITQRILDAFSNPFEIEGRILRTTPSIGIAIYPDHGRDIETLLKHADTAMYETKRMGRNAYTVYVEQMGRRVRDKLEMEHQLRDAFQKEAFQLYYQPIVDLKSGKIVAVEALVRWMMPNKQIRMPDEFIQIAEDSGMIIQLGEWVLRTACGQLKKWLTDGLNLRIAVNLSTRQFQDPNLMEKVMSILREMEVDPSRLELEITESAAMLNPEESVQILRKLTENGVRIAIDDFGTGYSSLSYLKRIPAGTIKIDKTFVDGVVSELEDATIVKSVVALANALEKETVAEGIETREQYEAILAMGCNFGQGYWIGMPADVDETTKLLEQSARGELFLNHATLKRA